MSMSKHNYRQMVTDKCREKDKAGFKECAVGEEKYNKVMMEEYGMKANMKEQNIEGVQQFFYTRVRMQPFAFASVKRVSVSLMGDFYFKDFLLRR